MHCASCSTRIEKVLRKQDGILRADVNLATETAAIQFDGDSRLHRQIRGLIENLGFTAKRAGEGASEFIKNGRRPPNFLPG